MIKIYSLPAEVPAPEVDYDNYNNKKVAEDEKKHIAKLTKFLKEKCGFTGKHTGKILSEPFADGYAQYMVADGKRFALVHLPYGDAWSSPNVAFLTKAEVIRRVSSKALFGSMS